jgi:hypothetical protein
VLFEILKRVRRSKLAIGRLWQRRANLPGGLMTTITFLGERQDIINPDAAVTASDVPASVGGSANSLDSRRSPMTTSQLALFADTSLRHVPQFNANSPFDTFELRLDGGTHTVVGPNGAGKSNVPA